MCGLAAELEFCCAEASKSIWAARTRKMRAHSPKQCTSIGEWIRWPSGPLHGEQFSTSNAKLWVSWDMLPATAKFRAQHAARMYSEARPWCTAPSDNQLQAYVPLKEVSMYLVVVSDFTHRTSNIITWPSELFHAVYFIWQEVFVRSKMLNGLKNYSRKLF